VDAPTEMRLVEKISGLDSFLLREGSNRDGSWLPQDNFQGLESERYVGVVLVRTFFCKRGSRLRWKINREPKKGGQETHNERSGFRNIRTPCVYDDLQR
jgi:hypothetical protein